MNLVELVADGDCAFDQSCRFGHRVEGHAVYCHNSTWAAAPRKCRRTWYTGGRMRDEDCPGYEPNSERVRAQSEGTDTVASVQAESPASPPVAPGKEER